MFSIRNYNLQDNLLMAPMCGITHKPFRKICKNYGAGLTYTQMVSAKALTMSDPKSLSLLSYDEIERPIGFQIFGNDPEVLAEGARIAQDLGPDLLDLNMGCPAKKIVNDGGGSALLKDEVQTKKILTAMRGVLKIPFTVKMRSGWDEGGAIAIAKIAEDCGVEAITLHARTRAQGYSGESDWDLIRRFKEELGIPIIGNGDVTTWEEAHQMLKETGCDAVMVGRAGMATPWIFKSFRESKTCTPTPSDFKQLILDQYNGFFDFFGEANGLKQMRKHLCAYTKGLRESGEFRNELVRLDNWTAIQEKIHRFFDHSEM